MFIKSIYTTPDIYILWNYIISLSTVFRNIFYEHKELNKKGILTYKYFLLLLCINNICTCYANILTFNNAN